MTSSPPPFAEHPQRHAAKDHRGFWVLAVVFTTLMSFTTIPTPMYLLYQQRDGFPTFVITLIFAAYGFGVMGGLYLAGHVSDYLGRRRVILAAIALELCSAVIFVLLKDTVSLLIARLLCGFGIGVVTATATAYLSELYAHARPTSDGHFAGTVATAVNTGGLALGPLIAGFTTQLLPAPLTLTYVVFVVLLLLAGLAMLAVPETVQVPPAGQRPPYRPQNVVVEPGNRARFSAAAVGAAGAFSVLGFFTSLTATFVGGTLHHHSRLLVGAIVFGVIGGSTASQVLLAALSARRRLQIGMAAMGAGLVLVAIAALTTSLPLFTVAGVVAGSGVGLVFNAAIVAAGRMASPEHRGETLAGMFLAAYTGITIPVILVGIAVTWLSPVTVLVTFAAIVLVAVLFSTSRMLAQGAGEE